MVLPSNRAFSSACSRRELRWCFLVYKWARSAASDLKRWSQHPQENSREEKWLYWLSSWSSGASRSIQISSTFISLVS